MSEYVKEVARLLGRGHIRILASIVGGRLYSTSLSIGLRRDLTVPFEPPAARITVHIRELAPDEDLSFLKVDAPGLTRSAALDRIRVRRLYDAGLRTGYAAVTPTNEIAFLQWVIPPTEASALRALWGELFPDLGEREVLFEGAYTPEAFRGMGIMSHAMAILADRARDLGARSAITFVSQSNAPALKACRNAGFSPYVERRASLRFFHRGVAFGPVAPA